MGFETQQEAQEFVASMTDPWDCREKVPVRNERCPKCKGKAYLEQMIGVDMCDYCFGLGVVVDDDEEGDRHEEA